MLSKRRNAVARPLRTRPVQTLCISNLHPLIEPVEVRSTNSQVARR
jgi:hypothetical protein